MKKVSAVLVFHFLLSFALAADTPWTPSDATRPPSWVPNTTDGRGVGVAGGIPNRPTVGHTIIDVTASPHNADSTGATDAVPGIASAFGAAVPGDVVFLPSGTYKFLSGMGLPSGISIRGAGLGEVGETGTTTIDVRGVTAFYVGQGDSFTATPTTVDASTMTRDSSVITVGSASGFSAGRFARIYLLNDASPAAPVFEVYGINPKVRFWDVVVTGISGTDLTIEPHIHGDFSDRTGITIVPAQYDTTSRVGIESLVIDGANSSAPMASGIIFNGLVRDSWVKNVKIVNQANQGINASNTVRLEVRHARIEESTGVGTSHSGILISTGTNFLIEDNIIRKNGPLIELWNGAVGGAVVYNFFDAGYTAANVNTNHAAFSAHNVFEGNYTPNILDDGYYAGTFGQTYFRNWVSALANDAINGTPTQTYALEINRFARYANVVGNIFLAPGYTWGPSYANGGVGFGRPYGGVPYGEVQPSLGTWWRAWDTVTHAPKIWPATLTERLTDTSGVITLTNSGDAADIAEVFAHHASYMSTNSGVPLFIPTSFVGLDLTFYGANSPLPSVGGTMNIVGGQGAWWELDLDVEATSTKLHNFDYYSNSIPTVQAFPGGTSLGDSLLGFTTASPPQEFLDAGLTFPPFTPSNAIAASIGSIPAGARYLYTIPPEITTAQFSADGTTLVVVLNKGITPDGGTGGFSLSAVGVDLTYQSVAGSTITFTTSRTIFAGEGVDLTYTSATNRWEDSNGNDLLSRSAFHVINLSTNTGSKVIYWAVNPDLATDTPVALPGPGTTRTTYIDIPISGLADNVTMAIAACPDARTLKVAVYDASGALVSSVAAAVTVSGENQFVNVPSFPVTPQRYTVAFQANDALYPTLKVLNASPSLTTKTDFAGPSYSSFPLSTISPAGTFYYDFAVGIEVIPDQAPARYTSRAFQSAIIGRRR